MRIALRSILILTLTVVILGAGQVALAQETCGKIPFIPSVTIPGTPIEQGKTYNLDCTSIGTYIISLYQFGVYAASVVAAVMIMVGGFLWVTAGGNASQVSTAKSFVGGALSGFVLLLGSWLILNTINPNLVRFNPLNIPGVGNAPVAVTGGGCGYRNPSDVSSVPNATGYVEKLADDSSCNDQSRLAGTKCYCFVREANLKTCCARYKIPADTLRPSCRTKSGDTPQRCIDEADTFSPGTGECPASDPPYAMYTAKQGETCEQSFFNFQNEIGTPACSNCGGGSL